MDNVDIKKITPEKIIIAVFSAVIIFELIWAGYTFVNNKKTVVAPIAKKVENITKTTSISIVPQLVNVKKGEKFTVAININSDVYSDGTDISLTYDPKFLSVVKVNRPVQTANIYNNYPQNKVDAKVGVITVSGVTDKKEGVLTNGVFGTIEFIAKNSGETKISIDFTPLSTTDSNIIKSGSGVDVLEKVENTEVSILP